MHRAAVVFACDTGHLPLAMFCADRIRRTEPDGQFDVVICMPDIGGVDPTHLDGPARLCEIDVSILPDVPQAKEWITAATYFKWLLPETLGDDYDLLFYLDTDTYLARPGIGRLFSSVDQPFALAASQEFWNLDEGEMDAKRRAKVDDLGGASRRYFNAGVFLCQPEGFLGIDGPARLRKAMVDNIPYLPVHKDQDQGAMNLAFSDQILTLNPLFNWRTQNWMNTPAVERYQPYILHFTGPNKPWSLQDNTFVAGFAREYTDYLGRTFPDFAIRPAAGSLAWRREHPKHRSKLMQALNMRFYKRRYDQKHRRIALETEGPRFDRMDAAIRSSEVGNPAQLTAAG
ncbi:glycosyltransferase [Sulfitobacter sp. D35]|uniref:glycosyltransferase family 8 protein n=1 Tax=Sulfitobacter sp. D35 TaxID=3083252 RepID=UPI00296F0717|nr:glycosyltransferase [Sulfitobacter sp. D35]MDW4498013.1 glycosyltransferase [Sulfitobacter sp. D35]